MRLSLTLRRLIAGALLLALLVPLAAATPGGFFLVFPVLIVSLGGWWWWRNRQTRTADIGDTPSLDAYVRDQASDWDARHGPDEQAEGLPDDEAWRGSAAEPVRWDAAEDDDGDDAWRGDAGRPAPR